MVSQQFPNIAATSFGGVAPVTLDQNAFVAPGAPVVGTAPAAGQGTSYANLTAEQLASVIAYQNARLSALEIPTMQGNLAVQNRQLDQNQSQFDKQLFFNEQAQRAAELQAYRSLTQQGDIAERARQTTQMGLNFNTATQALQAADQMATQRQALATQGYQAAGAQSLGLQGLGASSYGQAEQLRQGLIDKALQTANLVASLRGPSNAFKQLEVNGYLGGTGAGSLLGALAGGSGVPAYRGMGGTPEAATLGTLARDAGSPIPTGSGDAFSDSAGIQGLLGIAGQAASGESADVAGLRQIGAQNSPMVPSMDGKPLDQFAQMMAIARMNQEAGQQVLGPAYGPGSDFGSWVVRDYNQALAQTGETYMGADDPRLINIYRTRSGNMISETQARQLTHYAEDYYRTYGQPMIGGMLNESLGQVLAGQPVDATKWSPVNQKLIPGYGTPDFKPPPKAWTPDKGAPPPNQAPPPPPPGFQPGPTPFVPGPPATPRDPAPPGVPPQPFQPAPFNPPPGQVAPAPPSRLHPGSGIAPTGHQSATPKGWNSPEGYPAVTLGDGRAGYYVPATGQVIDGKGNVLDTKVNLQQGGGDPRQTSQVMPVQYGAQAGQAPAAVNHASPGFVAPPSAGPGGTTVLHPTTLGGPPVAAGVSNQTGQVAAAPSDETFTFTDALPGGKGRGFLGTKGSTFDETWNKITW